MDNSTDLWIVLAGLTLITILLVVSVRRAWLWRSFLLWVFGPAALFFVGLLLAALLSPGTDRAFDKVLFAFILLTSVAIVPWAAVCGLGLLAGLLIRRALRGTEPRPPPTPRPPRQPGLPLAVRFAAWRSALVILALAITAIAGATYWSLSVTPRPAPVLTPLPSGVPTMRPPS